MRPARILRISRPRFWLYEAGTFLVGLAAAHAAHVSWTQMESLSIIAFLFYFIFPANLLIYGINDIFDYETDKLNPKKVTYEALVEPREHRALYSWITVFSLPLLVFLPGVPVPAAVAFFLFVFCAIFYSATPIRAKARPGLDSLFSAGHYVATGVFGYYLAGATGFAPLPILGGLLWAMAMHAFSAVPDIAADTKSRVPTIATQLGPRTTLWLCLIAYALSGYCASLYLGILGGILGALYAGLMLVVLFIHRSKKVFVIYTYFPTINAVVGMIIFFAVALK